MHTVSSTWPELLGQFFQMFTKPGAEIFLSLMTGWVLCTARRTVTGILPFADPACKHAHDAYHRFFPDARWAMARLWRKLTLILVARFCPKGTVTLALDDTLFHHTGRKINGAVPAPKERNWPSSKKWPHIFKTGKPSCFLSEAPWLNVWYIFV